MTYFDEEPNDVHSECLTEIIRLKSQIAALLQVKDVSRPRLSDDARNKLLKTAEAEYAVGSRAVADALRFLLKHHQNVSGALAAYAAWEKANG